jgi:hypothetical protein
MGRLEEIGVHVLGPIDDLRPGRHNRHHFPKKEESAENEKDDRDAANSRADAAGATTASGQLHAAAAAEPR